MQGRERMFFGVSEMTAWKFVGTNALNILYLLQNTQDLHGRKLQQLLWQIFDEIWTSGNDLTYTVLNTYEKEGYVKSHWDHEDDPDKKAIRYYHITDQGINYLQSLKTSFLDTLTFMQKLFNTSLDVIWGDKTAQVKHEPTKLISSSAFTTINVLNLFYRRKYDIPFRGAIDFTQKPSTTGYSWIYAKEAKDNLYNIYNGIWKPSDGVLYPLLSDLCVNGYLLNQWSNDEEGFNKKRTVRGYSISESGENLLLELTSLESGLKNKILQLGTLCEKSIDLIYGNTTKNRSNIIKIIRT